MGFFTSISSVPGLFGQHALARAALAMNTSMERLATGKKINRGADDPSGIQVVDQMKAQLKTINKQLDNLAWEEKYLGARDGAESVISDLLIELQGHVLAAANTGATTAEEREAHQREADSIIKTISHLAQTTTFNGQQILTGYDASHLGRTSRLTYADDGTPMPDLTHYSLADLLRGGSLDLLKGDLKAAQEVVDSAVNGMARSRGAIGTRLKAIDSERSTLMTEFENLEAARSGIEDTDYAEETSRLVRASVLKQASMYVMQLAQQQQASTVLQLLG